MNKLVFVLVLLITVSVASAHTITNLNESCYAETHTDISGDLVDDLIIENTCEGISIEYSEQVNLSLGLIQPDELIITKDYIYVDSSARPDLDKNATLRYTNPQTVLKPLVYDSGVLCASCSVTHTRQLTLVDVPGFSNYTLQPRQDFEVYSDLEPELPGIFESKVYQTVDLGTANASATQACIVNVFGNNERGDFVLVQSNPEREAQGNFLGDPDTNQPESLGYFQPKNGLINTYFRGDELSGYNDFHLVIQCRDDTNELLAYEEAFSTRYSPAGRTVQARSIWLTDGDNAFYLMWILIGGLVSLWVGGMIWKSVTGRR